MKLEIKQRIAQLNNGEIPNGYKKTEFGVFPCDWITDKKLKDIGSFGKGRGIPGERMQSEGVPCVGYGDIYMKYNFHFEKAQSFVDEETAKESQLIKKGTLLFTGTGETADEIGKCVCYNGEDDIYAGGDIITFTTDQVNPLFIAYQQYQSFSLKKKAGVGQGHSVVHIQKENLEKLNVAYPPSLEEQSRIAEILMKWDEAIKLYQQQIEKLNKLKRSAVAYLFPQKGQTAPKYRFAGFTNSWKTRKFSDLAETRRGLTYSPSNIREAGIRVLRSSNIAEDQFAFSEEDVFVEPDAVNIPYANRGDILITSANGSTRLVGKHTIIRDIPDNSAVHGGFMLLATAKNPEFVNVLMSTPWYSKFISTYVAGGNGAIGNLNKNDLDEQDVLVPDDDEQKAIGDYFCQIDNLITLHQRKVEIMIRQRRVLQQFLLNGIVRVH